MTSWTEIHYERAELFLRQLDGAFAAPAAPDPARAPASQKASTQTANAPAASPPASPAPPGSRPPPPGPTAASVFQKIPWKK